MPKLIAAVVTSLACLAGSSALAQTGISAEEAAQLRAEIARLKAQVEGLEKRLNGISASPQAATAPAPAVAVAVAERGTETESAQSTAGMGTTEVASREMTETRWKGGPEFSSGDLAFKMKGRIQADAGYVSKPEGLNDRAFGLGHEFRRLRLGAEGALGGGVGYEIEFELSDNSVELVDAYVTYETGDWVFTVGNHNAFQSLDELTGDTTGSFMERAAFTDAFNFERRLGLSAQRQRGTLLLQTGVFTDDVDALSNESDGPEGGDENNSVSLDQRVVYAPKLGETQIHIGASAHWRNLNRIAETPSRYRQRAYLHFNNSRILATPELSVDHEFNYGLEAALIRGRFHMAGETHWMEARRPDATDPTFFGGYAEVGWFLTPDDTRAYRDGVFGRSRPSRPLDEGGLGSLQLNLRYDYLSLNDEDIRGGEQHGYLSALIWAPLSHVRLNLNYGYLRYSGAALSAGGDRNYGVHTAGARIELDF